MSQQTKVNTTPKIQQAENATLPSLPLNALREHLSNIDEQALTAQTLCEIAFEIIDGVVITDPAVDAAITRLDALIKSAYRNAISIQEYIVVVSLVLEDAEGVAA